MQVWEVRCWEVGENVLKNMKIHCEGIKNARVSGAKGEDE